MKRFTTKKRYLVWTVIWTALFLGIMAWLPLHYVWLLPTALWIIVVLGLIKDVADFFIINKGMDSFMHPWFEHLPLMVIVLIYSLYNLYATGDYSWIFLIVVSAIDIVIDSYQDRICCLI